MSVPGIFVDQSSQVHLLRFFFSHLCKNISNDCFFFRIYFIFPCIIFVLSYTEKCYFSILDALTVSQVVWETDGDDPRKHLEHTFPANLLPIWMGAPFVFMETDVGGEDADGCTVDAFADRKVRASRIRFWSAGTCGNTAWRNKIYFTMSRAGESEGSRN